MTLRVFWALGQPHDRQRISRLVDRLPDAPAVTFFDDGRALLEALEDGLPDLVVLGLRMARLDGIGTLSAIRERGRTAALPVVAFSRSHDPIERRAMEALGIRAFVQRPVGADDDELEEAVQRVLRVPVVA